MVEANEKMGNHHTVTVTITPIIDLRSPKYICYKKKKIFVLQIEI